MARNIDSANTVLVRVAGILPIVGGALLIIRLISAFFRWSYFTTSGSIVTLVLSGLAIAGGILVLKRMIEVAPWLLLAATVLSLVLGRLSLDFQTFFWPWEPLRWATDLITYEGVFGLLDILSLYSWWLIAIGAVLSVILFAQASSSTNTASGGHDVNTTGLAVQEADGSIRAGWYADPDGKPSERYWDGDAWTAQTRPLTTATSLQTVTSLRKPTVTASGQPISDKSRAAAAILCWFLGVFGIHRFYVGKVGTGIAMLFTLGGLGIWALIDFIMILVGSFKDISGKVLMNW